MTVLPSAISDNRIRSANRTFAPQDGLAIAGLLACWIVAVWLVDPRGNFPIVDDWAYVSSLERLRTTGRLVLSDWTAANLVSQLVLALPFTFVLPPNFETARLASLVTSGLVGPMLYTNLRLVGAPPRIAAIFTGAFIFNPIFFFLSFTYMTDIYYTALQALAGLLLGLALLRSSMLAFVLGWLAGIAALLSRQVATAIPIAFAFATLATRRWTALRVLICGALVGSFVAIQSGFRAYLTWSGKLPRYYGRQSEDLVAVFHQPLVQTLQLVAGFSVTLFFYAGLLLLPCTIAMLASRMATQSRRTRLIAGMAVGVMTVVSILGLHFGLHKGMPYFGDTLTYWGVGADLLTAARSPWYGRMLTLVAALGGSLLVVCLILLGATAFGLAKRMRADEKARTRLTLLAFYAAMPLVILAPVFVIVHRFDRYLLPALISCIVLLAAGSDFAATGRRRSGPGVAAAGATAALFLVASVVFTHDYLAERRVVWQALNDLTASGVRPEHIDAGWVFNALSSYGKFGDPSWVGEWYERRDFVIGLSQEPGFETIRSLPARGWAPWTHAWQVFVLKGPTS